MSVPEAHPGTDQKTVKNTRVFSVLGEFFAIRFKELNTYSGRLTRCIATVFGRICDAAAWEIGVGIEICGHGYALVAAISDGACSRRHHGPARRAIKPETISVVTKPVGAPASG